MRFNRQHRHNVPYGHKDDRFSKAYITKVVNQLEYVQRKIAENDWKFAAMRYEDAIAAAPDGSFIYCDPPYIGLTSTYYDSWDEEKETRLHDSRAGLHRFWGLSACVHGASSRSRLAQAN